MFAVVASSRLKLFCLVILLALFPFPRSGLAHAPDDVSVVRISQVFPGGGSSSAPYGCDFVELFNSSSSAVQLEGWSVQYMSSGNWALVSPGVITIPASAYYLIAGNPCNGGGRPPVPPVNFEYSIALSTAGAWVALVRNADRIAGVSDPDVADFVGYGSAKEFEGSGPAPALSVTTSAQRKGGGCQDTNDNKADFEALYPAARNSASPRQACADSAPTVSGVTPADGSANVAPAANLTVTFSEPVTVSGEWFRVECDLRADITTTSAAVTGGPTVFTIDPNEDLYGDDSCRLTVFAGQVKDEDAADPPDQPAADYQAAFTTAAGACGDPAYRIHDTQGDGSATPVSGRMRTFEGVVTGDFQGSGKLGGFYMEEEAAGRDADDGTSEGIFVSDDDAALLDVAAGQRVRVTGRVSEADGQTTLAGLTRVLACGETDLPPPPVVQLPAPSADWWEQVEGMRVAFDAPLTVAGTDELGSAGRMRLVSGQRPLAYTQQHAPDAGSYAVYRDDLARRSVILDDGSNAVYPDPIIYPAPGLTAANTVRVGDLAAAGLIAVVDGRNDAYRGHPTSPPVLIAQNPRPDAPAPRAGNVRATFLSLDDFFTPDGGAYGPRGASNATELQRQRDKLVAALAALDADVIGMSRRENDGAGAGSALGELVAALNAASPDEYAAIEHGDQWGGGEATVGLIYRVERLRPLGDPAMLDTGAFAQTAAEPAHAAPMAQSFEEVAWGERFTVVVNQWRDREDCPAQGPDADHGDGQGCWNDARSAAAQDLSAWLASDPTGTGDPDVLVLGELNAFRLETPMQSLQTDGYTDLIQQFAGNQATTMLWSGEAGYADHALASAGLARQAVGAGTWRINADEPAALDYQTENKSAGQAASLYAPDAYRASDRDPILVDLALMPDQSDLSGEYGVAWHTGQGEWRLGTRWGGEDDGVARDEGTWNRGQGKVYVSVDGPAEQFACLHAWLDFSDGDAQAGTMDSPNGEWDANEKVIDALPLSPGEDQPVEFPLPAGIIDEGAIYNMRFRLIPAAEPLTASCGVASVTPTGRVDGGEVEDWVFASGPLAVRIVAFDARPGGGPGMDWPVALGLSGAGAIAAVIALRRRNKR